MTDSSGAKYICSVEDWRRFLEKKLGAPHHFLRAHDALGRSGILLQVPLPGHSGAASRPHIDVLFENRTQDPASPSLDASENYLWEL